MEYTMKSNKRKALELEAMLAGVEVIYINSALPPAGNVPSGTRCYCSNSNKYFIRNNVTVMEAILANSMKETDNLSKGAVGSIGITIGSLWRSVSSKTFFDLSK